MGGVVGAVTLVSTTLVRIVVVQLTMPPPPFAEPLHWSTVTGNVELTIPVAVQCDGNTRPPPLPDPLHWVMVAPVVFAGYGLQVFGALPRPSPAWLALHWLTVAAVAAAGESTAMLFVMCTSQVIVLPFPAADPLHWSTAVTRSGDEIGAPPLMTMTDPVVAALAVSVLTIVTEHVTVWPPPPPTPLHWSNDTFAADAGLVLDCSSVALRPAHTRMAAKTPPRSRRNGR